ncbi:hypothetical protein, partial [Streptomyces sp. S-9]|uniref:hypothetical protein n=1 Tax=Streptomyces sp. S-9 TaxID=2806600 RepID=UPI00193B714E
MPAKHQSSSPSSPSSRSPRTPSGGAPRGRPAATDFRGLRRHVNRSVQRVVNRFCEAGEADLVSQYAEHL